MATSGRVVEEMAQAAKVLPATVLRMVRTQRAAGLVPSGEIGGVQRVGHFDAPHLVNLVLGFAGSQPADSAEAAKLARSFHYSWAAPSELSQQPTFAGDTLGGVLDAMVGEIAQRMLARAPDYEAAPAIPDAITISLTERNAEVVWRNPHGLGRRSEFYAEYGYNGEIGYLGGLGVVKQTTITSALLYTAGELLADTIWQRTRAASPDANGGGTTSEQSTNENTPNLPGSGVSTKHNNQPRALATGHSDTPDYSERERFFQSHPRACGWLPDPATIERPQPAHVHATG